MSSHREQYRAFAYYNRVFNKQLYDVAATLTDVERKADRGAFFRSIHITLNHILMADRVWLARFRQTGIGAAALEGVEVQTKLVAFDQELYSDFAELTQARAATDAAIVAWTDALTDAEIAGDMIYKNSRGDERRHPAWVAISHLFNHQTHHRGQVTTLLSQLGKDPGVTDFAMFVQKWPVA